MPDALELEYACYAILGGAGEVVEIEREAWVTWRLDHPKGRVLRRETVEGWTITTAFVGISRFADGPPRFWQVRAEHARSEPVECVFASCALAELAHERAKARVKVETWKSRLSAKLRNG